MKSISNCQVLLCTTLQLTFTILLTNMIIWFIINSSSITLKINAILVRAMFANNISLTISNVSILSFISFILSNFLIVAIDEYCYQSYFHDCIDYIYKKTVILLIQTQIIDFMMKKI